MTRWPRRRTPRTPGWHASRPDRGPDERPRRADARTWCRDEEELRDRRRCRVWRSSAAWLPPSLRRVERGPRGGFRAASIGWAVRVFGQAALDSIWVTLLGVEPPIAMRRGFFASGISRCRSTI